MKWWVDQARVFTERLRATGWRGLLVVTGTDPISAVYAMSDISGGDCVQVSPEDMHVDACRARATPGGIQRILGMEFSAAIIAVPGLIRPSIIAAAGETIKAGGFLALVAREPAEEWNPSPKPGRGLYGAYLKKRIRVAPLHLWVDDSSGRVVSGSWKPPREAPARRPMEGFKSRVGVPRRLRDLARTRDQLEALESLATFLRGRARSALVTGDRGRGKSFLLGLVLALSIYWHLSGRAVVVAPTPDSASSVMHGLIEGLKALDILGRKGVKVVEYRGVVVRVSGPWFRISYEPPDTGEYAPLVVIDEAASIGVARVRRLTWRSGKSMVSTTIHGYEGSGRAFARILPGLLPKPSTSVELAEPIRYNPGDPLEAWLYETFLLKAEPQDSSGAPPQEEASHRVVDPNELLSSPDILRYLYGILVQAHYRNTPDDILAMLEAEHHSIHVLEAGGVLVAVADVVREDESVPPEARIGLDRLLLMAGGGEARAYRVSRIAVHPDLQRRGYGSKLLAHIEDWARRSGVDLITAIFGRHDVILFWLKAGYKPFYVSPRYNKFTGEKNVGVAKPLTPAGEELLARASAGLTLKLLYAGSSVYRDLAAEKLALLLEASEPTDPPLGLTPQQSRMIKLFMEGGIEAEQAIDGLVIAVAKALAARRPLPLQGKELIAVIARVVQGKPYNEVASILGVTQDEAVEIVNSALRKLLSQDG